MKPSDVPQPSRRVFVALFVLLLAAGLGLRLAGIGDPQLWEDDYLNLDRALMPPGRMIAIQQYQGPADTIFDFQPPLSYLLVHAALTVSDTVLATRMPSLLAGALSLLAVGLLGTLAGGRRAGLCAVALCALSLFHLDFSRAIKPYALFLCTLGFSQYFLIRCLSPGQRDAFPFLAAWSGVTALMLTTAYQGVPVLACEGLAAGLLFVARKGVFAEPGRGKRLAWLALAGVAAVAAWLPLVRGLLFIQEFLKNPSVDPWRGLSVGFFGDMLRGLFYQHAPAGTAFTLLLGALVLLGALGCARLPLLVLAATGVLPAAAMLTSQTDLRPLVSWRHLSCLMPLLAVCLGVGADRLAGAAARVLPAKARPAGALACALAVVALAMTPVLRDLPEALSRSLSNDRDLMRYVSRLPAPDAALAFTGYQRNARNFSARWHLPGRFDAPGDFAAPGYVRALVLDAYGEGSDRKRPPPPGTLLDSWGTGLGRSRLSLAGLPSRAPLLLAPDRDAPAAYADDFRDRRAYNDAFALENFTPDPEVGLLRPTRYEVPAAAVWRFVVPPGARVAATVTAALYKRHPGVASDARLTLSASADGRSFTPVASLGHGDFLLPDGTPRRTPRRFFEEMGFYDDCREATARLDLTPFAAGGAVSLRLDYAPGVREGFLNVSGLAVTATEDPAAGQAAPPRDAAAFYAANLARNCASPAYRPGVTLVGPAAYVFAAPGRQDLARTFPGGQVIGAPGELARFEADHPGLAPAYVLPGPDGSPAVVVHDPALDPRQGSAHLSEAAPRAVLDVAAPFDVGTLWLWGRINAPSLTFGHEKLAIPVAAPPGSVLRLTPGGQGLLTFTPDFDPPDFTDGPNARFQNMALATSYPEYAGGVTCRPETDCRFEYVIVSGLPVTELRLMTYPRLYGGPGPKGRCRAAVSTNGRDFDTVVDFRDAPDGDWSPLFARRFARVRFEKPVTFVTVRFTLAANAEAEFWSHTRPVDRMVVEAALDARSLPPLTLPAGEVAVTLSGEPGNDLRLLPATARPGLERVWPGD